MIGQMIGNYRVIRKIGSGAMGMVYEARHQSIGRPAAIKVLRANLTGDSRLVARFQNEACVANLAKHPGLVNVFEHGRLPDGAYYLVMEYLEGELLTSRLQRAGRLGPTALRLGRQLASALSAAHASGVVHRDLKPDNVMIVPDPDVFGGERVKVLDFGIAKIMVPIDKGAGIQTNPRAVMGTPSYISPEQCQNAASASPKSDVYSLGAMLYEMQAGRPPFVSEDPMELLGRHVVEDPPPLLSLAPDAPPDLAALVHAMLAKSPEARPTMTAVMASLDRLIGGAPLPADGASGASILSLAASEIEILSEAAPERATLRPVRRTARRRPVRSAMALVSTGLLGIVMLGLFASILGHQWRKGRGAAAEPSAPVLPVAVPPAPWKPPAPRPAPAPPDPPPPPRPPGIQIPSFRGPDRRPRKPQTMPAAPRKIKHKEPRDVTMF